ncbi:MAG: DNA polymerase II [Treponema sp.]|jgi:DNA polymerase-2|nr:DNA polymerase II [Treponema sp.]
METEFRGFLVHCYGDLRRNRIFAVGRLEDGRSFAAVESRRIFCIHIFEGDRDRTTSLPGLPGCRIVPAALENFSGGEKLYRLEFPRLEDRSRAAKVLAAAGIPSPDGDMKAADLYLSEKYIRGPVILRGPWRPGRRVDLVFPDPVLLPPEPGDGVIRAPLLILSVDIETDTRDSAIRAVGTAWTAFRGQGLSGKSSRPERQGSMVRVCLPPSTAGKAGNRAPPSGAADSVDSGGGLIFHNDEPSLLRAFIADLDRLDPDVLTGWNFLDFDFRHLSERCAFFGIPFALGRSGEEAKFFAGGAPQERRSAAALVPGRQVIDALRIVRSGPQGNLGAAGGTLRDYSLETVSRHFLGEGKLLAPPGEDKIAALDRLYTEDPRRFGEYCRRDAELVPAILEKTGLFALTVERACLTGVSLDKAWTSVVSFERIYGMELRRRNIAPPPPNPQIQVSGAAGGTVLDPLPGLFDNVAVFDFRSLYPTIMRTFNIDPLTHARASAPASKDGGAPSSAPITAPNGAAFCREPGPLPELIGRYFAARSGAIAEGNETAVFVYKILMNSFYGVLGTGACRYGRTELAGAITSFARKWLLFSRDWFTERGYRVLYGDTDSLFVETGFGDGAELEEFRRRCGDLAGELNRFIAERVRQEYGLESFIELRFEKAYRRFLIPPLRAFQAGGEGRGGGSTLRGRAKGYGGYLVGPEGTPSVEVKGMEAVRSDATPLARRLQKELLELIFSGRGEDAFRKRVQDTLRLMREGTLDDELVYRKRLARFPETYTSSTPPQVKAARALGWKNRRGTVEYVWTLTGAEPASLSHAPLDYDHYAASQVLPLARSLAAAAGWDTDYFPDEKDRAGPDADGQMELEL